MNTSRSDLLALAILGSLGGVITLTGCSDDGELTKTSASSVVGGSVVDASHMSAAVFVTFPERSNFCTGTFVTQHHVLIAAHCVRGATTRIVYTNAPYPTVGSGLESRREAAVRTVHVHPAYRMDSPNDPSNHMDLAVIELADGQPVTPLPLQRVAEPGAGSRVGVLGYGCGSYWGSPDSKIRKYAEGTVKQTVPQFIQIDAPDGFALCAGDSGGPLVQNGAIVGVARYAWWGDDRYVDRSEYVNLATAHDWLTALGLIAAPPEYVALVRSVYPGGHWASVDAAPPGFTEELRFLIKRQGDRALYACKVHSHAMITPDPGCEGQQMLGLLGYLDAQADGSTTAIYRCLVRDHFDHFFSPDPGCEGQIVEYGGAPLGWARWVASPPAPPPPPPPQVPNTGDGA